MFKRIRDRAGCSICGKIFHGGESMDDHRCLEKSLKAKDAAHRQASLEPMEKRSPSFNQRLADGFGMTAENN